MAYCVVRTDLMSGTTDASCLEHGRYYNSSDAFEEIQNGSIVQVGALEDGERESHKYTDVQADATRKDLVLIAVPELIIDTARVRGIENFVNKAGTIMRGYHLHDWDEFSVTKEGFDAQSTLTVGDVVSVAEGKHIMNSAASAPDSGAVVIGTITHIEVKNYQTFYTIRVK